MLTLITCPLHPSEYVAIYTAVITILKTPMLKVEVFQIYMVMMLHVVLVYNLGAKTSIYSVGSK